MKLYHIGETLLSAGSLPESGCYAARMTPEEWEKNRDSFGMDIDLDLQVYGIRETQARVNADSLTGSIAVPDRKNLMNVHGFAFALDERGIVLIDGGEYCDGVLSKIAANRKWRYPSLERLLYDFVEEILSQDSALLESMEKELEAMERVILSEADGRFPPRLNDIRGDLLDLRLHYEEMMDLVQELEENENEFFREENLRYFHLLGERISRLLDRTASMRDYTMQLRDLVQTQLGVRQNNIVTYLTVVTTIFVPLTLITGWYGMNFTNMPELSEPWAYPLVILLSLLIVVVLLWDMRKKKWI